MKESQSPEKALIVCDTASDDVIDQKGHPTSPVHLLPSPTAILRPR